MENKSLFHDISIRIVRLMNIIFITVPFVIAWYSFYADDLWVHFEKRGHWLVILLFIFLYVLIGRIYEAFLIPRIGDLLVAGAQRSHIFHLLMLRVERFNPPLEYVVVKRLGDIVLSVVALILFSPVMLATAICIKVEDGGPVIYKQVRLTKDGKPFRILKFRSMSVDAEADGVARLSSGKEDDRVTNVGRLIRRVRIDELPQLLNIIKGDLSIVGVGLILRAT